MRKSSKVIKITRVYLFAFSSIIILLILLFHFSSSINGFVQNIFATSNISKSTNTNSESLFSEKGSLLLVSNKSQNLKNVTKPITISKDKISTVSNLKSVVIEKNGRSFPETIPNDTFYSDSSKLYALTGTLLDSWNLRDIGLNPTDEASNSGWKITTGFTNTIVATIDTGIDLTHPELSDNLWVNPGESGPTLVESPILPNCTSRGLQLDKSCNGLDDDNDGFIDDINGFNFADSIDANSNGSYTDQGDTNNSDVNDLDGHGTHVAGIIAGSANNGLGIAGICWSCKIMALKVVNSQGFAYDSDVASAIIYAVDHGASIINISLGGGGTSTAIDTASSYAFSHGVLVVSASGNSASDASDSYPGASTFSVDVGASDADPTDPLASYSNFGYRMDIIAPGGQANQGNTTKEGVLSTYLNGQYAVMKGTSMASPHVAGVAALLYDLHRTDLSPWGAKEIRYALLNQATDIVNTQAGYTVGFDPKSGYGKLNAYTSLSLANSSITFLSSDVTNPTVSVNSLANSLVNETVNITGSVNDANIYMYTVYFERVSDNTIIKQRSERGNVSNSTLLSFNTTQIPDDSYNVYLRAEDLSGNTTYSNIISMTVDNTPPSGLALSSPISGNFVNTSNPLLSWTTASDVHGSVKYDVVINGSTVATNLTTNSFQTNLNFSNGSTNAWYIVAKDSLGNSLQSATAQFKIDTTPPVISNTSIVVNNKGVTLSLTATEQLSGIGYYQISINGGAFVNFTPPYNNSSLVDGTYNFTIRVYDNAGSFTDFSGTFIVNARKIYLTGKGDFNNDGKVDLTDLSILAKFWGQSVITGDTNFDNKVDLTDLSILATNWGKSF